jgi:hypothetical protein
MPWLLRKDPIAATAARAAMHIAAILPLIRICKIRIAARMGLHRGTAAGQPSRGGSAQQCRDRRETGGNVRL